MERNLLKIQNPWWESPGNIDKDPHLLAVEGKPYFFESPLLKTLSLEAGDIHVFRGPRQVGKTTLIKCFIRKLLRQKVPANSILYLSCESITSFKELENSLIGWCKMQKEKSYLFLDEISFVPQWQRAVLALSNMGFLKNAAVILTGSNAKDLKESGERLPGRRGRGKDHHLYPFSFNEVRQLPGFAHLSPEELFSTYQVMGGFPLAIRDYMETGSISDTTYETYRNWIIGDAHRYGLRQETLRQILFRIAQTMASRITWPKLIENSPVKSHETALQYVEHLQDAFLCHVLHCYDPKTEGAAPQKARKIYFLDPLLYAIGATWQRGITGIYAWQKEEMKNRDFAGKILESLVVDKFKRKFERIYFWYSTKDGKEVDVVIPGPAGLQLFDIKSKPEQLYKALGRTVDIIHPQTFIGQ